MQYPNHFPLFFYFYISLRRDPHACNDDDNSISAIDSCLDRDRPRDVSPAARGREYRRWRSVLVSRAAQSVFVWELYPIFGARVLYVRQRDVGFYRNFNKKPLQYRTSNTVNIKVIRWLQMQVIVIIFILDSYYYSLKYNVTLNLHISFTVNEFIIIIYNKRKEYLFRN